MGLSCVLSALQENWLRLGYQGREEGAPMGPCWVGVSLSPTCRLPPAHTAPRNLPCPEGQMSWPRLQPSRSSARSDCPGVGPCMSLSLYSFFPTCCRPDVSEQKGSLPGGPNPGGLRSPVGTTEPQSHFSVCLQSLLANSDVVRGTTERHAPIWQMRKPRPRGIKGLPYISHVGPA